MDDGDDKIGGSSHSHVKDDDGGDMIGKDDIHSKKRKFDTMLSSDPSASMSSSQGRDWSQEETMILLNVWGERFVQKKGTKIWYIEWLEIADEVSRRSKIRRTHPQCKYRLDKLKREYRKLKHNGNSSESSKWFYFDKMELLYSALQQRPPNTNTDDLNQPDEMNSEDEMEEGFTGSPDSLKLIAASVRKLSEVFERVGNERSRATVELENIRTKIFEDFEIHTREMMEKFKAEIAKIWRRDNNDDDDGGDQKNSG